MLQIVIKGRLMGGSWMILLMEEIMPHLGCMTPCKKKGIFTISTG